LADCRLLNSHPDESTWKVEYGSRSFIMKSIGSDKRKSLLKSLIAGPVYSRRFNITWAARGRGCEIVPRMYLLAGRRNRFRRSSESYMLIEFLEGETLNRVDGGLPCEWLQGLEDTLAALHGYGLAPGNAHPGNLVKTKEGMKMIDISFKYPMLVSMANDIIDSGRKFGTRVPVNRLNLKRALALVRTKRSWQTFRQRIKTCLSQVLSSAARPD